MRPNLLRLPISHYCHKVEWAMADHGVKVDATHIWFRDLLDIRDVNPENTVPVLELDDRLICGSRDIMQWLSGESLTGHTLYPDAEVDAWESWADETIGPLARRDAYKTAYRAPWRLTWNPLVWLAVLAGRRVILGIMKAYKFRRHYEDDDRVRPEMYKRIVDQLDASGGPFLFGAQKTAADYAVAALAEPLTRIHGVKGLGHPAMGRLRAYVRSVKPRGSAIKKRRKWSPSIRARMARKAVIP